MLSMLATLIATYLPEKEEGQGLVEYALIIALVSIVLVAALQLLAGGIGNVFAVITATLSAA